MKAIGILTYNNQYNCNICSENGICEAIMKCMQSYIKPIQFDEKIFIYSINAIYNLINTPKIVKKLKLLNMKLYLKKGVIQYISKCSKNAIDDLNNCINELIDML